jgi:hypothetical protein
MSRALSELNKKLSRIEEAAREASGPVIIAPGVDYNETRKEIKLDQEKWLKDTFSGDAAARLVNQTLDYEDDNIHCDASFDRNTGEVVLNIRIKNSRAPYDSMWLSPFSQQIYAKTGERVEVPGFFGSDSFVDELGVPHKVTKIDTKNYYTPTAVDVLSRVKSFKVKISVPADAKEVQKTYDKNFTGVLRDTLVFQGQPLAVEWVTDYSVLPEATKEDFVKDAGRLNPKEVDSNWAMPNQTSRKFFASVQITIDEKNYKKVLDFLIALLKLKRYPFKDIYFSSNGSEASEVRDYFKKNCPDGIISSYTETGDPATDKGKITIYFGENSRIK